MQAVIEYQKLSPLAMPPQRMSSHAAGFDLCAALEDVIVLAPGERCAVSTGLAFAIPEGYEAQIRPRSGLALKHGIGVLNSPGTIDADYRGEVKVILFNASQEDFVIQPGMRIAQVVIAKLPAVEWTEADSLSETQRSTGGFGSTGH